MADSLETMFQNPVTALWAGQREGMDNLNARAKLAMEQENIRKTQQAYSQNEITNPLEAQKLRLLNEGYAAENPGKAAQSRRQGMEADTYAVTQPGLINKTSSDNETTVLSNNIKKQDALVDLLGKGAEALKKELPLQRHAFVYDQIEQMAGPQVRKHWEQLLNKVSGEDLPTAINNLAQHSAMSSQGMRQKLEELRISKEAQKEVARIAANASMYGADQRRDTAVAKQEVSAAKQTQAKTLEQGIVMYTTLAANEQDAKTKQQYLDMANQFAKTKAELVSAGKPDIEATTQGAVPTNKVTPIGGSSRRSPEAQAALELLRKSQK